MLESFLFWGFSKWLGAKIGLVSNGPHTESKGIGKKGKKVTLRCRVALTCTGLICVKRRGRLCLKPHISKTIEVPYIKHGARLGCWSAHITLLFPT